MKDKNERMEDVFSEVYDIICHMETEIRNRIPTQFINLIKDNRNKNYKVDIDYKKPIDKQDILHNTKVILGIIYRDFLVDNKKSLELKKIEKAMLDEKYDINNLLKKDTNKNISQKVKVNENNLPFEVKKQGVFSRIKKFIFRIFNIKK